MHEHKLVYLETKDVVETTLALDNYKKACDSGRGAVFLSIARGKVAEGIDFDNHYGRCVVLFGIPYQYTKSHVLRARLDFMREKYQVCPVLIHFELSFVQSTICTVLQSLFVLSPISTLIQCSLSPSLHLPSRMYPVMSCHVMSCHVLFHFVHFFPLIHCMPHSPLLNSPLLLSYYLYTSPHLSSYLYTSLPLNISSHLLTSPHIFSLHPTSPYLYTPSILSPICNCILYFYS